MNVKFIPWKIAAVVLIIAMLTGCQGARQALEPTVDAQPTYDTIKTQAVETAVAQMTLLAPTAAPLLPTEAPTEPPLVTETPTLVPTPLPSITPLPPTAIPTNTFVPWTATPFATATLSTYNCTITESSPEFGYDMRAGGDFDGRWVVKNTGAETWESDEVDIKYISGTKFQTDVDALDLSADVAKNKSLTVIVDMLAPNSAGRYSAVWAITRGSQTICILPLTIDVP